MAKMKKFVHGDDLLYRFFRDLIDSRPEIAHEVLLKMYLSMGIWFPLDAYFTNPVFIPFVVRDPKCRGDRKKGVPDQWGAPDSKGYFRDDNSMVKGLPRSLKITSSVPSHLSGSFLGSDFVAAHVWRDNKSAVLASRHPLLNTFVPNLVWLPSQIAKLTDREGSVMQSVLQEVSWRRYRDAPVIDRLQPVVDEAWELLERPEVVDFDADVMETNFFIVTDKFLSTRDARIKSVVSALRLLKSGDRPTKKVVSTRYSEGLADLTPKAIEDLLNHLNRFIGD